MTTSFGWDLAGYASGAKNALCHAVRSSGRDIIEATIMDASFIRLLNFDAEIKDNVNSEIKMLEYFAKNGNTYLDVPIDLQLLQRIADYRENEPVQYYWQLVRRPVDQVFRGLTPLASNIGYIVARSSHILGQLAAKNSELRLGQNLFETYPAATLTLLQEKKLLIYGKYKGGNIFWQGGKWKGKESKNKSTIDKNKTLASLASALKFQPDEDGDKSKPLPKPKPFTLSCDEFDAIICAITGCMAEYNLDLKMHIQNQLSENYPLISTFDPPKGYVLFNGLPKEVRIKKSQENKTVDHLINSLAP